MSTHRFLHGIRPGAFIPLLLIPTLLTVGEPSAAGRAGGTDPLLDIQPRELRLVAFSGGAVAQAALTVHARFPGRASLRAFDRVPWLRVEPAEIEVGTGVPLTLRVEVLPATLAPGRLNETVVLEVEGDVSGAVAIPVEVTVLPAESPVDKGPIALREFHLRGRDGHAGAQFLELVAVDDGVRFSGTMRLVIRDRMGVPILDRRDLFPAELEGTTWARDTSWLVATPGFVDRSNIVPDHFLSADLDPVGGSLTLRGDEPDAAVHFHVTYGSLGGGRPPRPGFSLVRVSPGVYEAAPPTPQNSRGESGNISGISCPRNTLSAGGMVVTPDSPTAQISSGRAWASYDLRRARIAAGGYGEATVRDRFVVLGRREGTLVPITAVLVLRGSVTSIGRPGGAGSVDATLRPGSGPAVVASGIPGGNSSNVVREAVVPLLVAAHAPFELTSYMNAFNGVHGGTASGEAVLTFRDVAPGLEIRSCQGHVFRSTSDPPPSLLEATRVGPIARLTWRVPGGNRLVAVERRLGHGPWRIVGGGDVGPADLFEFRDEGLTGLGPFEYRLDIDGQVSPTVQLPEGPTSVRIHLIGANPARGPLRLFVELPDDGRGLLELFDVAGRLVARRELADHGPGLASVDGDLAEARGGGLYFLRLTTSEWSEVRKVVVLP